MASEPIFDPTALFDFVAEDDGSLRLLFLQQRVERHRLAVEPALLAHLVATTGG